MLLAERDPDQVRRRLRDFYQACATADMDETTRLGTTIETWWPHILVFLQLGVTNARTEGFNQIIKQVKRVGCGYRNMDNYPTTYPHPHRGHPATTDSRMTGFTPPKREEPSMLAHRRALDADSPNPLVCACNS